MYWAGYPEQALRYVLEAVRQDPHNTKALLAAGRLHLEAGRHELARQYLERSLAVSPQSQEVWNNLAVSRAGKEVQFRERRGAIDLSCMVDRFAIGHSCVGAFRKLPTLWHQPCLPQPRQQRASRDVSPVCPWQEPEPVDLAANA